jgi:hypothetical protein
VTAVELLELRVGEARALRLELLERLLRIAGEQEDPPVAFCLHRPRADPGGTQLVEIADELVRQEHALALRELGDAPAALLEVLDLPPQRLVDLGDGLGEPLGSGVLQVVDPRERHAGVGEDLDADQVEYGLGAVAPVARAVAGGLGEQPALVVVPDRAHRDADVLGELADGQHRRRGGIAAGGGLGHDARGRLNTARAPT